MKFNNFSYFGGSFFRSGSRDLILNPDSIRIRNAGTYLPFILVPEHWEFTPLMICSDVLLWYLRTGVFLTGPVPVPYSSVFRIRVVLIQSGGSVPLEFFVRGLPDVNKIYYVFLYVFLLITYERDIFPSLQSSVPDPEP
jgi:hypothetical protein